MTNFSISYLENMRVIVSFETKTSGFHSFCGSIVHHEPGEKKMRHEVILPADYLFCGTIFDAIKKAKA